MTSPLHVMVIDDVPDDRHLAERELLRAFPDARVTAINGPDAFAAALADWDYTAVITDYALRWTTGQHILEAVKARDPYCAVIMFTNSGTQEIAVRAMQAGLDDYVIKSPARYARLPLALRGAIERQARARRSADEAARTRAGLDALVAAAHALDDSATTPEERVRQVGMLACQILSLPAVAVLTQEGDEAERQSLHVIGRTTADEERAHAVLSAAALRPVALPHAAADAWPTVDVATGAALIVPLEASSPTDLLVLLDDGPRLEEARAEYAPFIRGIADVLAAVLRQERLRAERAQAQAQALALAETNKRMDTFVAIAGHELRTPLTTILAALQIAARRLRRLTETPDAATREAVAQLQDLGERSEHQAETLNRLVGDILDVSRATTGTLTIRHEAVDLAEVVRVAVEGARLRSPGRDITLAAPAQPVPVTGDAQRLGQAVENYLGNALKFSREDQPVTVRLTVEGGAARVSVADEGPGIPPAEQERIWDRFQRVDATEHRTGASVGLGLGLYITRAIIAQHGGAVGVQSASGQGATFWFTLPLAAALPASSPAEQPSAREATRDPAERPPRRKKAPPAPGKNGDAAKE